VVACVTLVTFTDLVAYSIAVPVLPDYVRRFGASPATIGFLFGSFGITLLAVSIPMGAISDRIGRKGPMVLATLLLALSTTAFAFANSLPMLFGARLLQGVADGVTWVVGFALIADLYGPEERGSMMGLVMSATSLGVIVGPSLGGWLYELGGIRLPFLVVAAAAALTAVAFLLIRIPDRAATRGVPMTRILKHRAIVMCAGVAAAGSATYAMLEPVLPLVLEGRFSLGPARIGLMFAAAAVVSAILHPIYGRLSDWWGGRRLMLVGLTAGALLLPLLNVPADWQSMTVSMVIVFAALGLIVTPSLAYMAEAASSAGLGSFGVVYGLYNVAWGIGLLIGPSLGGLMLQELGFLVLTLSWSVGLVGAAFLAGRA
jgi:DHA1 family solute carrier family 18 vesicular amine transporter 1/2